MIKVQLPNSQQDQKRAENGTQDEQDNRPPPRLARLLQGMFGLVHGGLESFHLFDDEHFDWLAAGHKFEAALIYHRLFECIQICFAIVLFPSRFPMPT